MTVLRVHSRLKVSHAPLGCFAVTGRDSACVLLERVQQDDQIAGPLVEQPVASACEPNPQLP
jgi:hypothetical protein